MFAERSSRFARLRSVPLDLAVVLAVTGLVAVAVVAPIDYLSPLRVPLGFFFVFFVPGYVFVATLFPEAGSSVVTATSDEPDTPSSPLRKRIDSLERLVLSFGSSVAIVPGLALLLNYTSWGVRTESVLLTAVTVTVFLTGTALIRRLRVPEAERYQPTGPRLLAAVRAELFDSADRAEVALTVLLVAALVLAAGGVGYSVTTPADGEQFSAVYLLNEDTDGEPIADGYATALEAGESGELVIGIDNNEHEPTNYTVVVAEQALESTDGELRVIDQQEIERFEPRLNHGETWRQEQTIEPSAVDVPVRIVWLVYLDGAVPDEPSTENAAYHVHVWVDGDL
ncbi:DUF1616 domain-containing protein [Natronorubrum sulfidifaciens]|uniref:DUF1616 domain-containing protein n=1 Tax=Natronorubrum sulfidifaciens JCM 14089 TaxID=1230460 RepID=L9VY18_9EURY|nr:DUF1616 domain-containing protein [Natronorubrum sulfidifaciens]ELY42075.1 hypothetical protein C495_16033 [Natronorubrum sulfidifaciens JCM 14089]